MRTELAASMQRPKRNRTQMPSYQFENAIIVGGTGMLGRASSHVAGISRNLTLICRYPDSLAAQIGAQGIALNWGDRERAEMMLDQHVPCDLLITWVHQDGAWLRRFLGRRLVAGGRAIHVFGSASAKSILQQARLSQPEEDHTVQNVLLGWNEANDNKSWLTHSQISQGVIQAIQNPKTRSIVVGTLGASSETAGECL